MKTLDDPRFDPQGEGCAKLGFWLRLTLQELLEDTPQTAPQLLGKIDSLPSDHHHHHLWGMEMPSGGGGEGPWMTPLTMVEEVLHKMADLTPPESRIGYTR